MYGTLTVWATIGAIGMALGTLPPLWGMSTDPDHREQYLVLTGVTAVAAVAYALMALGVGEVTVAGRTAFVPRYLDWLITTPLILLFLAMLGRIERPALLRLVVADVVLLVLGGVAVAVSGPVRWLAFLGGVGAFGVLGYDLYERVPRLATFRTERARILFVTLRNLTIALWSLYPIVWVLAPSGVGLLTRDMAMLVVAYLDLISKAAFVALAVDGMDALTDHASDETVPVGVDSASTDTPSD